MADKILKEYKEVFEAFEYYDKYGRMPFKKVAVPFTIRDKTLRELRKYCKKKSMKMSHLVEELITEELRKKKSK